MRAMRFLLAFVLLVGCGSADKTNWKTIQGQYGGPKGWSNAEVACLKKYPLVAKATRNSDAGEMYDQLRPFAREEFECFGPRFIHAMAQSVPTMSACRSEIVEGAMRKYVLAGEGSMVDFVQKPESIQGAFAKCPEPVG